MDRLTDSSIGTMEILQVESHTLEQELLTAEEPELKVRYMEELIRRILPEEDEQIERIHIMIDQIHHNRDIIRVEQVSECFHMSPRSLQRLFKQYVGVSPKWVIRLYRLQKMPPKCSMAWIIRMCWSWPWIWVIMTSRILSGILKR